MGRSVVGGAPVVHGELTADDVKGSLLEHFREIGGETVAGDEPRGERVATAVVAFDGVATNGLERDVDPRVRAHVRLAIFRQVAALAAREVEHAVLLADVRADEHALHLKARVKKGWMTLDVRDGWTSPVAFEGSVRARARTQLLRHRRW